MRRSGGERETLFPEELHQEPRWSSVRAPAAAPRVWTPETDERLVTLVMHATASGERFPVGVNWLEVAHTVGSSPVECVKRYAMLHDARERFSAVSRALDFLPGALADAAIEEKSSGDDAVQVLPLSELSSGEEISSLDDFATPVVSPKLLKSDDDDFGFGSPGSPPPFAVAGAAAKRATGGGVAGATTTPVGSPFRWEQLADDPNYGAPVLKSPSRLRVKPNLFGPLGTQDEKAEGRSDFSLSSSPLLSPGIMSPRGLQGAQNLNAKIDANSILTHAFKGMSMGTPPLGSPPVYSPRLGRKISSSDFPFLMRDEESRSRGQSLGGPAGGDPPVLNDAYRGSASSAAAELQRQMNAQLMRMSTMSSFHGDNPFTGSVTQSALEDAFLDMAGSRLDASSVLLNSSRIAAAGMQSRTRLGQLQALERERLERLQQQQQQQSGIPDPRPT